MSAPPLNRNAAGRRRRLWRYCLSKLAAEIAEEQATRAGWTEVKVDQRGEGWYVMGVRPLPALRSRASRL
jgi:hypothetical protein